MTSSPEPQDPFAGDPADPAREMAALDGTVREPLGPHERESVLHDLEDLEVFQVLLEPKGVRGLVVDCEDCDDVHYFAWALLQANLRGLLDAGTTALHEPAVEPDASSYVSWDYARGYADAVMDEADDDTADGDGDGPD